MGRALCNGRHWDEGRREFLRVGSLGFLGLSLTEFLTARSAMAAAGGAKPKAESCILLWLGGAPSQVDTWDPKPTSSFKPIATNVAGIQISELLPQVAKRMDKLAIVRSVRTEEVNHPQATQYALTGHRPNPAMRFPSFGSIVTKELKAKNDVPAHVMEPEWDRDKQFEDFFKAQFLGPSFDPMILPDPSQKDFKLPDLVLPQSVSVADLEDRRGVLKMVSDAFRRNVVSAEYSTMDAFREQATKMILSPSVRDAFDLTKESEKVKDAYGRNRFGQSVLLSRRLIEAGSRFVTVAGYKHGAWDTHSDNDKTHRDVLVPPLDQGLSHLLDDLEQRGMLDSTIVLIMGEFGRTPFVNPNKGRDHWPHCWSLAMGGGGIKGGQVIGASDDKGAYVADREVSIGDIFATVYKALGIDWEKTYMTPIGRPIKIANSFDDKVGVPLKELV